MFEGGGVGGRKDAVSSGGQGSCLECGATFFFGSASMTKWSVCSHEVYKHSFL